MNEQSWLAMEAADPRHALPDDLRAQDIFAGRDIGWVEQMRPFVRQFSRPGECVLDPFAGLATTLLAAHLEGRRALGYEVDAQRCRIARIRLERESALDCQILDGELPRPHADAPPNVDLLLTNPPYFGCGARLAESPPSQQLYATDSYAEHLRRLGECFHRGRARLRPQGYCIVLVQNLRLGERSLPFAWDLARGLSSLFEACDERVLVYPQAGQALAHLHAGSNRAHEYALVFRKSHSAIDLPATAQCLFDLLACGRRFVVHGSFARWWRDPQTSLVTPHDADLLFDANGPQLQEALAWLQARGFSLSSWGEDVPLPFAASVWRERYCIRAERVDRQGNAVRLDLGFALDGADVPALIAAAEWVRGLPLVGSEPNRCGPT